MIDAPAKADVNFAILASMLFLIIRYNAELSGQALFAWSECVLLCAHTT